MLLPPYTEYIEEPVRQHGYGSVVTLRRALAPFNPIAQLSQAENLLAMRKISISRAYR
jgi:hypothetical protein